MMYSFFMSEYFMREVILPTYGDMIEKAAFSFSFFSLISFMQYEEVMRCARKTQLPLVERHQPGLEPLHDEGTACCLLKQDVRKRP